MRPGFPRRPGRARAAAGRTRTAAPTGPRAGRTCRAPGSGRGGRRAEVDGSGSGRGPTGGGPEHGLPEADRPGRDVAACVVEVVDGAVPRPDSRRWDGVGEARRVPLDGRADHGQRVARSAVRQLGGTPAPGGARPPRAPGSVSAGSTIRTNSESLSLPQALTVSWRKTSATAAKVHGARATGLRGRARNRSGDQEVRLARGRAVPVQGQPPGVAGRQGAPGQVGQRDRCDVQQDGPRPSRFPQAGDLPPGMRVPYVRPDVAGRGPGAG